MKKRKLLLVIATLLCSVGTWAQTAPTSGVVATTGEFYIYNLGTGKYLNKGVAWGTHSDVDGAGAVITISGEADAFLLHFAGIASDKYLGSGGYVDIATDNNAYSTWSFVSETVAGYTNVYKLKANNPNPATYLYWANAAGNPWCNETWLSADATGNNAYWLLIPKATREAYTDASLTNFIDVTWRITNPDFEGYNDENGKPIKSGYGWTGDFTQQSTEQTSYSGIFCEKKGESGVALGDISESQTLSGLPKGKYRLTASAYAELSGSSEGVTGAYIFAGDQTASVTTMKNYSVDFIATGSDVNIGMKTVETTADWVSFDNVRLAYIDPYISEVSTALVSGTAMEADKWYSFTPVETATYEFSTTSNIYYTNNGSQLLSLIDGTAITASMELTGGTTYYFKSTTAQTLYFSIPFEVGDYYIKNVGTGRYINRGHAYKKRSVIDGAGSYVTIAKTAAGQYTLKFDGFTNEYFGKDLFVDKNTNNTNYCTWSFLFVGNGKYKLVCNGTAQYLIWGGSETNAETALTSTDPSSDNQYWSFVTKDARQDLSSASASTPVDVTYLLANPDFEQRYQDGKQSTEHENGWTNNGFKYNAGNSSAGFGIFKEQWIASSSHLSDISISQSLTSLKNGKYRLTAAAHAELQGSSNAITGVSVYLGDQPAAVSGAKATKQVEKLITSGSVELGMEVKSTNANWVTIDDVRLYYLGNAISLYSPASFSSNTSAEKDTWYAFSVGSAGYYKISSEVAATIRYTQDNSDDADTGGETFDLAAGAYTVMNLSAGTFYFKGNAKSNISIETLASTNGTDVTFFISNPSFEEGNTDGWTPGKDVGLYLRSTQGELSNKVGTYYALIQKNGTRSVSQTISSLPKGMYILSVNAKADTDAGTVSLNMGTSSSPIPSNATASIYTVAYEAEADDASAEIKISGTEGSGTSRRCYFDNFTLTYYSTLPTVSGVDDLLAEPMAADVRATLDAANTAYSSEKTVANYNALQTAIINAKISIAEYASKTGTDADWTDMIQNASFEGTGSGSTTGWTYTTSDDDGAKSTSNDNYEMTNSAGSYLFNIWATGNTISQTLKNLPAGSYKLTAVMGTDAGSTFYLKMGDATGYATSVDKGTGVTVTVYAKLAAKGDLTISADAGGSQWYKVDNFQLTYNPTLPASLTAVDGKMNSDVENTQSTKVAAYNATNGQTIDNLVTAQAAMLAAYESKLVYNSITTIKETYDDKAGSLDAAGQAAYTTATTIASTGAETQYDEGSYTTAAEAETAYYRDYMTAVKSQRTANTDLTEVITNPSFETGDLTGWNASESTDCGVKRNDNATYAIDKGDAVSDTYLFNSWGGTDENSIQQTIKDLQPGLYRLTALLAGFNGEELTLAANSETNSVTVAGDKTYGYTVSVDFTLTTTSDVIIKASNKKNGGNKNSDYSFIKADNFRLTYLSSYYALDADYAALQDAIDEAEEYTLGFENGEYAPYRNIDALTALAAAKAIDKEATNTKTSVQTATSNLTGASWTANVGEVNAFCGGDFSEYKTEYNATDKRDEDYPLGWDLYNGDSNRSRVMGGTEGGSNAGLSATSSGKALLLKFNGTYGNTEGYTLPLKAGKIYKITFKHGKWAETRTNLTNVVMTDPSGASITLAPGFLAETDDCEKDKSHWYTYTGYFVSTTAGDYKFNINKTTELQMQTAIGDIDLRTAENIPFADDAVPTYAPGTYPSVKITRSLTAGRWATAVYPFAVSGVDKIAVLDNYNTETQHIRFTSAEASTANEPFLMRSTTDKREISLSNVEVSATSANPTVTSNNLSLIGTYSEIAITDAQNNYVLSANTIYPVGEAGATIPAFRAYIQDANTYSLGRSLKFVVDEEVTAIEGISDKNYIDGTVYNLNGQVVRKNASTLDGLKKGVYIVNGQRVIVK